MLNTINAELHGKRLTEFHLKRISRAYDQLYSAPITAYLSDVFISSYAAIGIVFGHERADQFGRFEDGHLMSTSHIRFARKEGRFWVLTTMRSRYVVASFNKDVGRASLQTFLRSAQGRHLTPLVLQ